MKLVGTWIKRKEEVNGAERIKSEKQQQYKDEFTMALESMTEWDKVHDIKEIWKEVNQVVVASAREVCSSMRVTRENPKNK